MRKAGFTILEILVVLAIAILLMSLSYAAFTSLSKTKVLEKNATALEALIKESQSNTKSSLDASRYGVYISISDNKAVLFKGEVYDPENTVSHLKELSFHDSVYVSELILSEESQEVVFNRPKGDTDNFGHITLSLSDDTKKIRTVVYPTGSVELVPVEN